VTPCILLLERFTQTDPMPMGAGSPFESSYVYAGARPTVMTDPGGERFGFGAYQTGRYVNQVRFGGPNTNGMVMGGSGCYTGGGQPTPCSPKVKPGSRPSTTKPQARPPVTKPTTTQPSSGSYSSEYKTFVSVRGNYSFHPSIVELHYKVHGGSGNLLLRFAEINFSPVTDVGGLIDIKLRFCSSSQAPDKDCTIYSLRHDGATSQYPPPNLIPQNFPGYEVGPYLDADSEYSEPDFQSTGKSAPRVCKLTGQPTC
jgi:hypothetical protein